MDLIKKIFEALRTDNAQKVEELLEQGVTWNAKINMETLFSARLHYLDRSKFSSF